MPILSEEVARMHVRVESRNGQIIAEVHGRLGVHLTIVPGYAERTGERELEAQLGRVAADLFRARGEEYSRIRDRTMNRAPEGIVTPQEQDRREELKALGVSATSADGSVTVNVVGMRQFAIDVAPGSIERLGSRGIAEAAAEAANRVAQEFQAGVTQLNRRHARRASTTS